MKDVFNNIDELILTKSYKDLSADERSSISEMAANESAFNQLKATLLAVQKQIKAEDTIEAKPETKAALMKEFRAARPAMMASSSKMGLGFFFPKGPLQRMPGLQILTAAACLLMIFTVFRNLNLDGENVQTAHQKTTEDVKKVVDQKLLNKEEIGSEKNLDGKKSTDTMIKESPRIEKEKNEFANFKVEDMDAVAVTGSASEKFIIPSTGELADEIVVTDMDDFLESVNEDIELAVMEESEEESEIEVESLLKNVATTEKIAANSVTSAGRIDLELADASIASRSGTDSKNKTDQNSVKLSRSLDEDAELIDLFYTAM